MPVETNTVDIQAAAIVLQKKRGMVMLFYNNNACDRLFSVLCRTCLTFYWKNQQTKCQTLAERIQPPISPRSKTTPRTDFHKDENSQFDHVQILHGTDNHTKSYSTHHQQARRRAEKANDHCHCGQEAKE